MYTDNVDNKSNSEMIPLEQPTIDWPSKTFFSIHLLQNKSILTKIRNNFEGTFPEIFKLAVFTLFLIPCIPFQHQFLQLEFSAFAFLS